MGKFISLTEFRGNPILVNADELLYTQAMRMGSSAGQPFTDLYFTGRVVSVEETLEEILALIEARRQEEH